MLLFTASNGSIQLCGGAVDCYRVGGDVVCAKANSGKAASLINNRQMSGTRRHVRDCNAISRLGSFVKLLVASLRRGTSRSFLLFVRRGLFAVNSCLTASRRGARLGMRDGIVPRAVAHVRQRVSHLSGRLPGVHGFVLPKKDHPTSLTRIYQAIYQQTRHRVCHLTRAVPIRRPILIFVGELSSCLFILTHGRYVQGGNGRVV